MTLEQFKKDLKLATLFCLEFDEDSEWGQLEVSFFLTLLWYQIGNIDKALANFNAFLETRADIAVYYQGILEYLQYKINNEDETQIAAKLLAQGIATETITEIMQDMNSPEEIFKNLDFPRCPDCKSCHLVVKCITTRKLAAQRPVQLAMSKITLVQKQ